MYVIYIILFYCFIYILLCCFNFIFSNINTEIPTVAFPFKNIYDDNGNKLNIILISAPFREKKHEDLYNEYKNKKLHFCGISSYLNFPNKIDNPYEDKYHEINNHDYTKMVSAWLYCFKNDYELEKIKHLPKLLLTEADLINTDNLYPIEQNKIYDFIYVCLKDNEQCTPGWKSINRNWELAKKCLVIMCKKYGLKGLLIGRENCEFTELCKNLITVKPLMSYNEFQNELKKAKMLFAPNITDASPRVITEAMCHNLPVIVNQNILGGWHNIISGITGEFFTDENDLSNALDKIINNFNTYQPREWYIQNRGRKIYGSLLSQFLIQNYPNINNKNMKYAYI